MCLCGFVHVAAGACNTEEDIRFLAAGIIDSCEPPSRYAES